MSTVSQTKAKPKPQALKPQPLTNFHPSFLRFALSHVSMKCGDLCLWLDRSVCWGQRPGILLIVPRQQTAELGGFLSSIGLGTLWCGWATQCIIKPGSLHPSLVLGQPLFPT